MTFLETPRFPTDIANGSNGGGVRRVDVVTLASGFEHRNAVWSDSLKYFDVAYGIKSLNDVYAIQEFWEAVGGNLHEFRFKNHADYRSSSPQTTITNQDQVLGTGDGVTTAFQLVKKYVKGALSYTKDIKKPVSGTVICSLNGSSTSSFTVDTTTGIVTFGSPPANGVIVRAGFQFDLPCRFDVSQLVIDLNFENGNISSLPIKEIKI